MDDHNLRKLYSDLFGYEKLMKEATAEYKGYSAVIQGETPRMKFLKDTIQECRLEIAAIQRILYSIN
jgi:hypothetical protein